MDFSWEATEPLRQVYNFSRYDALLADATANGVQNYWVRPPHNTHRYTHRLT
jgi:hypothetical protein